MQIIFEDEYKRSNGRGTDPMDSVICTRRISRYIEREYIRRIGGRGDRIQIGKRIFNRTKKEV